MQPSLKQKELALVCQAHLHELPEICSDFHHRWSVDPTYDLILPWGLALWRQDQIQHAFDVLNKIPENDRCEGQYLVLRGMVLRKLGGRQQEAEHDFRRAIAVNPQLPDAHYNLGNLLLDRDDFTAARASFEKSLNLNPLSALTWHNFGITLTRLQLYAQSCKAIQVSVQLDPSSADAWCNLGIALFGDSQHDKAQKCFEVSIACDQAHGASHVNIGNTLIKSLNPEDAMAYLERGIALGESSANSLWNLSLAYLLVGNFKLGWDYYEARFSTKNFPHDIRPSAGIQPPTLADCSRDPEQPVLIWAEQGVGDAIQFGRYLYLLQSVGVPFHCLVRSSLISLFRDWFGFKDLVFEQPARTNPEDQRQNIPLLSLPRMFETDLSTIPCVSPYIKQPRVVPDALKVIPPSGGLSIGLVWATNPDNKAMYRNKSCPLHHLMPLFERFLKLDLIDLHSLQVGHDSKQLAPWSRHSRIIDWSGRLSDFSDTAFVINQLDLVISVDTAVAHLAGALNRPTWLLLSRNADFRWMRDRDDTPWYSSMRLFRQTSHGVWPTVVDSLAEALDDLFLLDSKSIIEDMS